VVRQPELRAGRGDRKRHLGNLARGCRLAPGMATFFRRNLGALKRRPAVMIAAGGGIAAVLLLVVSVVDLGGDPPPASSEVLERVAARNREAAIDAAARMRAESEASTRAADARLRAAETDRSERP
jgi:hypothetical protein